MAVNMQLRLQQDADCFTFKDNMRGTAQGSRRLIHEDKNSDPVSYYVPLRAGREWITTRAILNRINQKTSAVLTAEIRGMGKDCWK